MSILFFAFSIVFAIAVTVVGLFVGHIIIFESLGISVAAGMVSTQLFGIHPAFSLLIGIAVFILFVLLNRTKFGFWIVSGIMSVAWGLIAAVIAYDSTGKDMIWTYVVWGLGAVIVMFLHISSREKLG